VLQEELLEKMDEGEKKEHPRDGPEALDDYVNFESMWRLPYRFALRSYHLNVEDYYDRDLVFMNYN